MGVVLLVVLAGWATLEFTARNAYNAAVTAINDRIADEEKDTLTVDETEKILGKAPDDAGTSVREGPWDFTKKTYTWRGLAKSYTLTAYYTKQAPPSLHHVETEGAHLTKDQPAGATVAGTPGGGPPPLAPPRRGAPSPKGRPKATAKGAPTAPPETKAPSADEKEATPSTEKKDSAPADAKSAAPAEKEKKADTPAPKASGSP
jgi:hypothetical protein